MFKFIEFLKKRPKDKTIRLLRVIYWLIIIVLLAIHFNDMDLSLTAALEPYKLNIKYSLFILGMIPIFMWIDICFAKRKVVKIIQIIFWLILIIVWNMISINTVKTAELPIAQSGSIDLGDITSQEKTSAPINVWFWIALLSIFPIVWWITGKCITQKCYKYGEVITKIRV
ncbi:MAG: hypothetical protein ACD_3C00042G0005 [uncultured bacterium (gcode 4)]|uniref:Uncharacterized protein n=1 Tax=uncultured bacterium (gcode 4) TaxID=1234023 RepID=K2GYT1_9BACT|nr:MAG: hypothetical protein ACD_3C00042G0005 [uncultured bacterium (gcode 4)]